jgi:hypothetical protein
MLLPHAAADLIFIGGNTRTGQEVIVQLRFTHNIAHQSGQADKAQSHKCKTRSNHQTQVSSAPGTGDNRKRKDKHSSAWFLRLDVHTGDK